MRFKTRWKFRKSLCWSGKKKGRRLLAISREMLYRMNVLGMVYRIDRDKTVLQRIDEELRAVCNFQDWNPSHTWM